MDLGKDLVAASATPLVLSILAEGESYGYAIIKRVRELSGGEIAWTDGMLYPVLHRLERRDTSGASGAIRRAVVGRKYYGITPRPDAPTRRRTQKEWQAVDETLRGVWSVLSSAPLPGGALMALAPLLLKVGRA